MDDRGSTDRRCPGAAARRIWLAGAAALLCTVAAPRAQAFLPLPTSGSCAFLITLRYPFSYLDGSNPGTSIPIDWTGTIDFGAASIAGNTVTQTPGNAASTTEAQATFSAPFTVSTGPIAGSYTLAFTAQSVAWSINVIPVRDGRAFLLQAQSSTAGHQQAAAGGVCRM
jgi:hypothetical protein